MSHSVDYYFAPQSPWAYLGHQRFQTILQKSGASVRVMPIDLGGKVFPISGGLPLGQRAPQRQAYRLTELARFSKWLGAPLHVKPTYFPVGGDDAPSPWPTAAAWCSATASLGGDATADAARSAGSPHTTPPLPTRGAGSSSTPPSAPCRFATTQQRRKGRTDGVMTVQTQHIIVEAARKAFQLGIEVLQQHHPQAH